MSKAHPPAECHPHKPHYARGMCVTCYSSARMREQAAQHGLSLKQLEAMCAAQDNRCAACGAVSEDRLQIDHDHRSGAIRGLLCGRCNSTAGHADDDVDRLMAVAVYLMGFRDLLRTPMQGGIDVHRP